MNPGYTLSAAICALLLTFSALAKDAGSAPMVLTQRDASSVHIRIDGRLDEPAWQNLPVVDDMVVIEPDTLAPAGAETQVRFFYTTRGLYVGVWCQQDKDSLVSRLSSRDQWVQRDGVSLTLDPSGQGLYGYWFGVNLGGTLQDGTVLPERQFSDQWNGPWDGASAVVDGGWSAEFFLPWSMMTMPRVDANTRRMGFYISRKVAHGNERWAYPALPRTKPVFLSALQPIIIKGVEPAQQFTFYPYTSATWDNKATGTKDSYKAGFDFFWRPSTNLQVTATLNPDFGNVESDNVVVNLTSVETFYPEKRAFFLEGNEIFVTSPRARDDHRGGPPITLLNTRRIGGPPRDPEIPGFSMTSQEENQPTQLIGAMKLTGQSGKFRYGVLGAFEDDTWLHGTLNGSPYDVLQQGRQFGVARVLYEDTSGRGRRSLGWMSTVVAHPQGDAVSHGIDGHYLTPDGRWGVDAQLLASDVDSTAGYGGFVDTEFTPSKGIKHSFAFDYFDNRIDINDFGFLGRNDLVGGRYSFEATQSDLPGLKTRKSQVRVVEGFNKDGRVIRSGLFFTQEREFLNNNFLHVELNYLPARWDDINSDGNGSFRVKERWESGFFLGTDESRMIQVGLGGFLFQEDLGDTSRQFEVELNLHPSDRFSLSMNVKHTRAQGWLIYHGGREFTTFRAENWSPRIAADFFLSAKQQFRITAQWAGIKAFEQTRWEVPVGDGALNSLQRPAGSNPRDFTISRLTFQARYRWEIAPLSDLYVVYTRGSDVDSRPHEDFTQLLRASWTERLVDIFIVKLRYRLGS